MSDQVLTAEENGLLTVTLNRPERRNAMTPDMTAALCSVLAAASEDSAIRAVLLTGAGGHFCVGGDVKAMNAGQGADLSSGERIHRLRERMSAAQMLHTMAKPTVAAVEGSAAGAGLSLAMACDFRIGARDAKLTTAFANVALAGDYGGSFFLSRIVGPAKARELYLLSPLLSGSEAEAIGLLSRAVDAAEVMAQARELAARLAAGPTRTLGLMKQNLNLAAATAGLSECLDQEARNHILSAETGDHREAAAAFVEKRPAQFTGR